MSKSYSQATARSRRGGDVEEGRGAYAAARELARWRAAPDCWAWMLENLESSFFDIETLVPPLSRLAALARKFVLFE